MTFFYLLFSFFSVAFIYSLVGFGGGSSYLALLALPFFEIPYLWIPLMALSCNLTVTGNSTWAFFKNGYLDKKSFFIIALSLPAAFGGALIPLREDTFYLLISGVLMTSSLIILKETLPQKTKTLEPPPLPPRTLSLKKKTSRLLLIISLFIGFLSGMSGIGGGIYLSPLLLHMKIFSPKKVTALCSFFIFFNSLSGIMGQILKQVRLENFSTLNFKKEWIFLIIIVFLGGRLGNHFNIKILSSLTIKILSSLLIFLVGFLIGIKTLI